MTCGGVEHVDFATYDLTTDKTFHNVFGTIQNLFFKESHKNDSEIPVQKPNNPVMFQKFVVSDIR